ncbi:nuclear pore complex protein DDB_G0274915-like [Nilaparvata lugens]|uniref:nuclear pore complex protein DDB_G0274915-like n=1 Tax=Nilaparvata lugens TaxID=108931 RepID=UPI00193DE03C|nr:nuclear pore complex protein DDB_G0274915-like [Nilaparvata lugens]
MFGGGSVQKPTTAAADSKSNLFAFQPSAGFSFAQPPKETADKVEGAKVAESSATPPVAVSGSDSTAKTASDKGTGSIFGGGLVSGEKASIFGGSAEKSSVFGGGTADKGGIFGGTAEKGNGFGGNTVAAADKGSSIFGGSSDKGGLFGAASTVSSSPVSFSFTQSLANAAVSTSTATPTQGTSPATTSATPQPGSATGFPVVSAATSSTTTPQPTTFSNFLVTSTVSESTTVSAPETTPSSTGISFSNFNFGSSAQQPADANTKMGGLSFGQSASGISGSIFGGATTITPVQSTNVFGGGAAATTAESTKTQAPFSFSISDSQNSNTATPKSSFFGSKPLFGTPTATSQQQPTGGFFGAATTTATAATKPEGTGLFGQATLSSPFGQSQPQSSFGGPPTFGQPAGGSLFGQSPSSGFGSQGSSVFGGGGSMFGGGTTADTTANQPSGGLFSSPATGGLFGNSNSLASPVGSFSQPTSPSISQTGFGTAFQNKPATFGGQPAFGAPSSFGGAPTFGGSATFGSPNKVFGSPQSAGGK